MKTSHAIVLSSLFAAICGWSFFQTTAGTETEAMGDGRAEALKNIRQEIYGLKIRGDENDEEQIWIGLLRENSLELYIVPPGYSDREEYIAGYNEEIRKALTKRYGYDLLAKLKNDAANIARWHAKGKAMAAADIENSGYKLILIGLMDPESFKIMGELKKHYPIDFDLRGCVTTSEEMATADAYNETMTTAIKEKFGRDVVAEAFEKLSPERAASPEQKKGEEDAYRDFSQNIYKVYEDTKEPKWSGLYCDMVRANGIQVEDYNDAAEASGLSQGYYSSYSGKMRSLLQQKFGEYFFERIHHKAQRDYAAANKKVGSATP